VTKRVLFGFIAGFVATLVFHQPVLWLLHSAGVVQRAPYNMKPVPPLSVPSVVSLAFWGGVWGIIMILALARVRSNGAYFLAAAIFGAILPTLAAWFISAPLHGQPAAVPKGSAMLVGFAINAAWGLGTAVLYRAMGRGRK
jgi:hypothetical protein